MPHRRLPVQPVPAPSRRTDLQPETFSELFYDQLRNAPWVMCSLAFHGVLGIALLLLPSQDADAVEAVQRIEVAEEDPAPDLEDPPPEVPPETPLSEVEQVDDEVDPTQVVDAPVAESPDESEQEAFEDPIDGPVDWVGTNRDIGIGGGGGGGGSGFKGGRRGLKARGTSRVTESAVDLALEWLKNHQSRDGRWAAEGYTEQCKLNTCPGTGEAAYSTGVSGLALLAFLGHGDTHQSGPYKDTLKRGLKYLKDIQDSEGCFGPRTSSHFQYNHATAALAMAEAYGLTGSRIFRDAAQRGVDFVHRSQNPYLAWRYGVRDGDNDTSVTGWMTMVLKSAHMADLEVDKTAFKGAIAWIDRMTEPEFGRTGYQTRGGQSARTGGMVDRFPADKSEALTAVAVTARIFAGEDPSRSEAIQKGVALMERRLPRWDLDSGDIDMYYWYYGTLAMFQVGGKPWQRWNEAMKTALIDRQRQETGRDERGSWDPVGPWGPEGGRVYSTATMAMCLEVYYRYGPVFGARATSK